jgi:hypothetical protein
MACFFLLLYIFLCVVSCLFFVVIHGVGWFLQFVLAEKLICTLFFLLFFSSDISVG